MRSVHRLRQAHSLLHQSLAPRIASSSSSALASVAVAPAAASFHSSSLASFAAPAAAGKAAGGAASAAANIPPPEGSTRWLKEGWGAPRLVPSVTAEAKVNADGLVVDQAASDAAEAADRFTLPVLHAEVREHVGSRYSRYLRQQRMRIPGIICDRSNPRQNQLLISLDRFELEKLARQYRRTLTHKVCLIKIEGQEPIKVIADELQRHAVTDELLVANWFLFKPNREQVRIKMPIVYTGTEECIGVKRGGVIVILRDHVPCVWTGDEHLPPFIHIDMTNTDGGKVFRNADLRLPAGLRLVDPKFDYVVATVLGVKHRGGKEMEEEVVVAAAATTQQPSAIQLEKEKKEKERREEEEMVAQKLAQKAKAGKK